MILLWVLFRPISLKLFLCMSGAYSGPCQTSKMEFFCENSLWLSDFKTNFAKRSMLDVCLGSECASLHLTVFKSRHSKLAGSRLTKHTKWAYINNKQEQFCQVSLNRSLRCPVRKLFWKISWNLHKNTCTQSF